LTLLLFLPEVSNIGFETLMAINTLCFAEDSVVSGEEEIVEKLE
jgi:hypothetical protein